MRQVLSLLLFFVIYSIQSQNIVLEEFGPTFSYPTNVGNAGDSRMFISEQEGYIYIINSDGTSPATPFLDIESKVADDYQSNWEAGLLGFTFHPNYSSNGYIYVYYTKDNEDAVLSRFTVTANPDIADASSELIIMDMPHPYDAHYGGHVAFGPDGYLYISKGDGGTGSGDPDNRAQNLNEWNGKILRIDVDNPSGGNNYGIPSGNPYANDGDPNTLPEIWHYGLRNPAKFSFDRQTGDLWIGDVGQDDFEEVLFASAGTSGYNFGWNCFEGNTATTYAHRPATCPNLASTEQALLIYPHTFDISGVWGCSISGGFRHRGTVNTNLNGTYFFADWCSNNIMMITYNGSTWDKSSHNLGGARWVAFGEDTDGELYALTNPLGTGRLYKISQEALSTDKYKEDNKFTISPNPADKNLITLTFKQNIEPEAIKLYNLQGQKVLHLAKDNTFTSISINVNKISSGAYIVEVQTKKGEKFQNKLIIK